MSVKLRGDMIEVFKMLKGFYVVPSSTFFNLSSSGLRGHSLKLFMNQYSSNIGKFSFSNKVVLHWNKLSEHVVLVAQLIISRITMIILSEVDMCIKAFFPLSRQITFSDGITLNHIKTCTAISRYPRMISGVSACEYRFSHIGWLMYGIVWTIMLWHVIN